MRPVVSLLVCVLVFGGYIFLNSSLFYTEELVWTGLEHVDAVELHRHSAFQPNNALRIDVRGLAARLTEHPWVKTAHVRWNWPNILIVEVQERQPVAMLPIEESWFLLDTDGALLPPPLGYQRYEFPLITHVDPNSPDDLRSSARTLQAVPPHLLDRLSEWNGRERVLIMRDGTRVLIGELQELRRKFELLDLIFADLEVKGELAERIDLRVLRHPVVVTK